MRKVILYIAMSLDGFIADSLGGVQWLEDQAPDAGEAESYSQLMRDIDTVLMGWNTYHQVIAELSPGQWPYQGMTSYVFTHQKMPSTSEVRFVAQDPAILVEQLRREEGKDIWICGGANLAQQLIWEDAIDIFHLTLIPTILGSGVRLFGALEERRACKLISTQECHGMVELIYERRGRLGQWKREEENMQ